MPVEVKSFEQIVGKRPARSFEDIVAPQARPFEQIVAAEPVQPVGPRPVAGPEFTERGLAGVMQTDPRVRLYTPAEQQRWVKKGEALGLPEIAQATKQMIADDELAKEIGPRLKWYGKYIATLAGKLPVAPEGEDYYGPQDVWTARGKFRNVKPELKREAEEFKGFGPALMPLAGEAGTTAIEWGLIYPKLFQAMGMTGEAINQIPQVQKAGRFIKAVGGIDKLAARYPATMRVAGETIKGFAQAAPVGMTTQAVESLQEDLSAKDLAGEILQAGLQMGIVGAAFSGAAAIDTAQLAKSMATDYQRRMPELQKIPKQDLYRTAEAAIDTHKVKIGMMSPDQWHRKHAEHLQKFSDMLKNLSPKDQGMIRAQLAKGPAGQQAAPPRPQAKPAAPIAPEPGRKAPYQGEAMTPKLRTLDEAAQARGLKDLPIAPEAATVEQFKAAQAAEAVEKAPGKPPAGQTPEGEPPTPLPPTVEPQAKPAKMPEHKRTPEGLIAIPSDLGEIQIPEDELTGEYGKDLETIFRYGNFQSETEQPNLRRSLSVGDTVTYRDHTFMALWRGWRDITGLSDDAIKAIQTSENAVGPEAGWRQTEQKLRKEAKPPELADEAKNRRRNVIQNRIAKGEKIAPEMLSEFAGEPWADEALAKREGAKPGKQSKPTWDYRMWGKGTAARMIDEEGRPVRRIRATLEGKTVLCENPKHARGIYRNGGIAIKPDGSRWAGEPAERAEPDVEKQKEDARYRAELARTTRFIREHPIYQAAVQGREDQAFTRTGGLRMIYVPEAMASDVESYAGQDRRKGLWRYITHDAKAAQHYDDWASELGLEGTLDAAMTRLQQLYEAEREMGKGAISESVFEEAVRQANDVELEVVAMKRELLRRGETFENINKAMADYVHDFAEFSGTPLSAEAQADIIETQQIKGKGYEAQQKREAGQGPPVGQRVHREAPAREAGAEAQATPPEGQRRQEVTPEEPAPPAPVTKADTGVFGQTIFRPATGTKQGELGLEFAPKGKEAVPIKPELAKAVAGKAGKAKDAKSLYLDAFTDKSDLFQNPDNPMPEMQEAWDQATKGRRLPAAETTPEAKPPERPLVNPHASALKRDAQLRRQQAWDKKYGQAADKGKQGKGETPPSDPTLGRPSAMGGFAGGRPGAARANVSAIVAEKMDTGSKSGNDFLKRTKGYTRQTRPGPLRNTARHLARFAHNFRFLPEIPRTRQFAEVREAFRHILAIPKLAYTHSVDDMRWALKAVEGTATEARKRIQAVELKLIADDLMEDVESGVKLPADMTAADVAAMKAEGDRLYEKYPTVREALDRIREANQKVTDMLVAEGWLAPERAREFYFPHKVIRYLRSNDAFFGIGRKPAEPRKGYLRQRKGGSDYSTDVLERLIEHWAEVRRDVETSRFLEKAFKQEHGAFRKLNPNWKPGDALPAEYKEVTILPGRFYYRTNGVTEDLAMALLNRDLAAIEAVLEEQGLKAMAPVREMLALGRRRAYVVRREIAQQVLDMPTAPISDQPLYKAARSFNTFVKRQILFNPLYAIPFHVTNFIGDYHRMIIALPSASEPKYIAGYWKAVLAAHKGERPALLGEAQQYDVIGSGWLGVDVKKLESIIPELERAEISGAAAVAANRAKRLFNTVRAVGQGREDWLRYATFMRLCDLQDAGKDITKLSVKDVEVVRGLTGHVQAAKIARDIMLDYAAIGKSAQMMSEVVSPFYRWMHLNIPWWPRMAAAYAKRGQAGRLAWAIMTAFAPYILAHLWNTSDDERRKLEERLPPWRRYNFHIIAKGKVWYVPLPTDDLANFLGVPESAADFKAYQKGLIDVRELICRIAGNGLYNPGLGVINSVGGAGGVLRDTMGIQTFPDIADYRITSWQRRALNVAKTIFGAPAQLAEAAKRGDAAKVHDLLWRSVLPVRGWTPTAEPLDILAAHTYRADQERSGNPLEWRAHKGEEKAVSRLKAQIADLQPEEIRQWRSEYERQRRREAMERKRERIRALRAERPKEK